MLQSLAMGQREKGGVLRMVGIDGVYEPFRDAREFKKYRVQSHTALHHTHVECTRDVWQSMHCARRIIDGEPHEKKGVCLQIETFPWHFRSSVS